MIKNRTSVALTQNSSEKLRENLSEKLRKDNIYTLQL
jgi:hypothetical protein